MIRRDGPEHERLSFRRLLQVMELHHDFGCLTVFLGSMKMFARAPSIAPLKSIFSFVLSSFLKCGMPTSARYSLASTVALVVETAVVDTATVPLVVGKATVAVVVVGTVATVVVVTGTASVVVVVGTATVVVVVGTATSATCSPTAAGEPIGITVRPVGTALRKKILVFGSYAVKLASGEATNMKRVRGVVVLNVPTPFATSTGPSIVTAPVESTA